MNPRGVLEPFALAAAGRNVRAGFVRLPPAVHAAGDHGFVPMLIATLAVRDLRPTPATVQTAGLPCIDSKPLGYTELRWKRPQPVRAFMPPPKKASL